MGVFGNLFSRPENTKKHKNTVEFSPDISWNTDTEHHFAFVAESKECLSARTKIQSFVRKNPLEWEYLELFAPESTVLSRGGQEAVNAIKDFQAYFIPVEKDVYQKISRSSPQSDKSLIICIQNASFFSVKEEQWKIKYPAVPYKAAQYFVSKLQNMMNNSQAEKIYIILMDKEFSDYGYLASDYAIDFAIEIDDNDVMYKVNLRE